MNKLRLKFEGIVKKFYVKLNKRGAIVKINQKICSVFVIIFAVITLCLVALYLLNILNINLGVVVIFVGLTNCSGGLSQINLAQQIDSEGNSKGNKIVGILSVIAGIVIIITTILEMIF